MRRVAAAIIAVLMCAAAPIPANPFPGPWYGADERKSADGIAENELAIQRVIVTHNIHDCEQYFYRQAKDDKSTFLLYCRNEGPVLAFVLRTSDHGMNPNSPRSSFKDADGIIKGPMPPFAGIPFPQFCCLDDTPAPPKAGSYP